MEKEWIKYEIKYDNNIIPNNSINYNPSTIEDSGEKCKEKS